MQPSGAGADESHQRHCRWDAEGEYHISQDVVDVHAPCADAGEEANPLEGVDKVDDYPDGEGGSWDCKGVFSTNKTHVMK